MVLGVLCSGVDSQAPLCLFPGLVFSIPATTGRDKTLKIPVAGPVSIPEASVSGQSEESSDGVCVSMDLPQVEFSLDPVVLGVRMLLEVRGIPWFLLRFS